jgi:hypothetical protein
MPSPEVVQVNHDDTDQEDVVLIVRTDLDDLTYRRDLEPTDDQVIHVYSAPRDKMVETGDIVFRRNDKGARFYDVDYATTMRYPATTCTKVCSPVPYQLFLQLSPITDPSRLYDLLQDLAEQDSIPF